MKRKIATLTITAFLLLSILPLELLLPLPQVKPVKAPPSQANVIFQDWFDYQYVWDFSDDSGEDYQFDKFREYYVAEEAGGIRTSHNFSMTTDCPINGTYSLEMYINNTENLQQAYAWQGVFNVPDAPRSYPNDGDYLFLRVYLNLTEYVGATSSRSIMLLSIQERSGFTQLASLSIAGTDAHLQLRHRNETGFYITDSSSNVTLNSVHAVELGRYRNDTVGYTRVWLDGSPVSDISFDNQNTTTDYQWQDGIIFGNFFGIAGGAGNTTIKFDGFKAGGTQIGTGDSINTYELRIACRNATDNSYLNGSIYLGQEFEGYTNDGNLTYMVPEGTYPKIGFQPVIDGYNFTSIHVNGTDTLDEDYPTAWGHNCTVGRGWEESGNHEVMYGNTTIYAWYGEVPQAPPSNYQIDDSFEYDGDYSLWWNGTEDDAFTSSIAYSTDTTHHGTNSSKVILSSSAGATYAYAYRDFGAGALSPLEFWLRGYVRYASLSDGFASHVPWALALYHSGGLPSASNWNFLAAVGVYNDSGTPTWRLDWRNATTNYNDEGAWSSFNLNQWYCFEIHYNVSDTDGCVELWIGENLNASHYSMDTNFSSYRVRYPIHGAWQSDWNNGFTFYVDCVRGNDTLSTARIGLEDEGDTTAPTFSNLGTNGVTGAGHNVEIQSYWNDDVELDEYLYQTNNTGSLVNSTTYSFFTTPSWANETFTLNSTVGVVVSWRFHAWDNSSNYNYTSPWQNITTTDIDAPSYSSQGSNATQVNTPCNLSSYWNDNNALSAYAVNHNNTGNWENITNSFGATPSWANETITLNSTVGVVVAWRTFANDTADLWNVTGFQYITTTSGSDGTPPTYANVAHNTTIAGDSILFSCQWTDETDLSGYIFGTNNTGDWVNETWASLGSNPAWANETRTLNSTVGVVVQYRWWCNDTSNNWNNTGIQSLTTSASDSPPTYSQISYNTTTRTYIVEFSVFLEDDTGLSICFFRWNGTGAWGANQTISVSGSSSWANITQTLPSSANIIVGFRWYFNDTLDQWNGTGIHTLVTTEIWYYYQWSFQDIDAVNVESFITWSLYNASQQLSYTEGASTLLNGTYILHTSYRGEEINQTTVQTWVSGNGSVTIGLQMKRLGSTSRWVAFNETISTITVHAATDSLTNFSVTGTGTFYMICAVPRNCSHIEKGGSNQTGWIYENTAIKYNTTLSLWEFNHAAAESGESTTAYYIRTIGLPRGYIAIAIAIIAWTVVVGVALLSRDVALTLVAVMFGTGLTIALFMLLIVLNAFSGVA